jgi:flavin reductase (DIM6/NTAB) family NADH-FMN oxidoreductase RutF
MIMKRKQLEPGALTAPLPPVMVTVGDENISNIITIGWTGILATVPPKTYISVRPSRHSFAMLKENGEFVINLPTVALAKQVDYAGIYTGAKVDKFEKCGFTKIKSAKVSPPTIGECPIALECKVFDCIHSGTHDIFMADIVNVSCDESLLDEKGRICFERAKLLAYSHGEYFALGRKLGKFGFSTDKKNKSAQKRAPRQNKKPRGKEDTKK